MTTSLGQTVLYNDLTPVRVVSVSNITATYSNGPSNNGVGATLTVAATSLTVEGVALAVGDRLLVQNQTNTYQNGIYIVRSIDTTVVLERAFDQRSVEQLKAGQFVAVGAGYNAGKIFNLSAPLPQAIGTDAFIFNNSGSLIASVAITAAEFNGMYAAPKVLVPAPGANKMLVLDKLELVMTYGTAAFAGGGVAAVQYDSTANGAGVIASSTLAAAVFQATASNVFAFNQGVVARPFTTCANKGLYLSNITGAFTTGDSTFVAKVYYTVIPTA